MHIDFNLGLQQLGVLSRRKFYPQQIDEILNIIVDEFIQDSVKYEEDGQHFHRVQVDVDRIKTLLIRDYVMDVNQQTSYTTGLRKASTPVPSDYAYLISDNLGLVKDCTSEPKTASNVNEYYTAIPIPISTIGGEEPDPVYTKYYSLFTLSTFIGVVETELVNVQEDNEQGSTSAYVGYTAATDRIYAIRLMWDIFQEKLRAGQFAGSVKGLYWERYGKIYKPNNFILVTSSTYDNVTVVANATTVEATPVTKVNSRITDTPSIYYTSRLTKASVIDNVLTTPFLKPLKNSPVSLIADNEFIAYTPENIIVTKAVFTYIRKPSKIDVALQRNCELPEEFHQMIVEKAIEYAAGKIEQIPLFEIQKGITDKKS